MARRIAAEYSDEVSRQNRKEDLLLERKLRVFDREERVTRSLLNRSILSVERFRSSIESEKRSPDLADIERHRFLTKTAQYGGRTGSPKRAAPLAIRKAAKPVGARENRLAGLVLIPTTRRLPPLQLAPGGDGKQALQEGQQTKDAVSPRSPRRVRICQRKRQVGHVLPADGAATNLGLKQNAPATPRSASALNLTLAPPASVDPAKLTEEWLASSWRHITTSGPLTDTWRSSKEEDAGHAKVCETGR